MRPVSLFPFWWAGHLAFRESPHPLREVWPHGDGNSLTGQEFILAAEGEQKTVYHVHP